MATQQSLFGATPESIQQARAAALNTEAAQYAQMDPFQRASFGIYKGANQLAGAVGGMLGGQDPQMLQMQKRQQLLQGVDTTNPQSLMEAAQRASQGGDYQAAQELATRAQAMVKAGLEGQKTAADTAASVATTAGKQFDMSPVGRGEGLAKTGKFTSESIAKYVAGEGNLVPIDNLTKPTADFAAKAVELGFGQKAQYGSYSPPEVAAINSALLREEMGKKTAGAPKTAISLGGNKYAENVGGKMGEADVANFQFAQTIPAALSKVDETLNILKNSDINTGIGAEMFTTLDRARTKFAADKKAGIRVSNTEYLNSLLGSEVFPLIQSLGIGARGMDTPAEREFLREVMTGTINLDKKTLVRMAELRKKAMIGTAEQYNKNVDSGELDNFFAASGRNKSKINITSKPAGLSATDQQALSWANANANDPRATAIKQRLGQ